MTPSLWHQMPDGSYSAVIGKRTYRLAFNPPGHEGRGWVITELLGHTPPRYVARLAGRRLEPPVAAATNIAIKHASEP